jgi:hypothetical protein
MEYPRFVILKHTCQGRPTHWDLMLEAGSVLHTWRLDAPPAESEEYTAITRIQDHEVRFLDYQGPVNEGKGMVEPADSGFYRVLGSDESGSQLLEFNGKMLNCRCRLEHISKDQWLMTRLAD